MQRGQRQPIPIRDMERERATVASGPVTTYKLPPEEIERIFGGKRPAEPSMPKLNPSPDGGRAARARVYKKSKDEVIDMNLTKEQYLSERIDGKTRNKICTEHGINPASLYHWLRKWGIKEVDDEELAIYELIVARTGGQPVDQERRKGPREADGPEQPAADPLADVEWFDPKTVVPPAEPTVSISKQGISFDGPATRRLGLKPGDAVRIGFMDDNLVMQPHESGIRVHRAAESNVRLQSRTLAKWPRFAAIPKRKYPLKQTGGGVFYIEVGEE